MSNPFQYPAWAITTAAPLDPLPYKTVSFGRQLNQPGPWSGSLDIADPRVAKLGWQAATAESQVFLGVDLNGVLVWSGVLWNTRYRKSEGLLQVDAQETDSYFRSRLQAEDYSKLWEAGEKPTSIAKRVVEDALGVASIMGGLTIVVHETGEQPNVTVSYPSESLQTIDSILSTLSQMGYDTGFDYSFDAQYKANTRTPELILNLWFPRQGRTVAETGVTVLDRNCLDWEYPGDGTQQANKVVETGSGGSIKPASAEVLAGSLRGYPRLERTFSRAQILTEAALANIAVGDLAAYCFPVKTPWLELPIPGALVPGEIQLGDDLEWRVDPVSGGENSSPRFPEGARFNWRMTGWTCTPADAGGISKWKLDLAVPPVGEGHIPPPAPPA